MNIQFSNRSKSPSFDVWGDFVPIRLNASAIAFHIFFSLANLEYTEQSSFSRLEEPNESTGSRV